MKTPFPRVSQSLNNNSVISFCLQKQKKEKSFLVRRHSRCSVAACILSKIVILLHVLHVCCSEFSEVLGATIVHTVRCCKGEVLSFIFPLAVHFWKNFWKIQKGID